jgi:hypothetical protein
VFFAGKACSNLWFLEQVRAAGAGIEVNSGGELWKALRAGFSPGQAVFNGVAKSRRELEEAVAAGVAGTVADSLFELRRWTGRSRPRAPGACCRGGRQRLRRHAPGLETSSGGKAGIDPVRRWSVPPRRRLAAWARRTAPAHRLADRRRGAYLRALGVALDLLDDVERDWRPSRRSTWRRLRCRLPRAPASAEGDYFFTGHGGRLRRRDLRGVRGGAGLELWVSRAARSPPTPPSW